MQMIILHGEHVVKSRNKLQELIGQATASNRQIVRFSGNTLDRATLESTLGSINLFDNDQLIVIEQIFSGRVSKNKTTVVDYLAEIEPENVVVWEDKKLGVRALGKFKQAEVLEFSMTKELFNWLDSIGVKPKSEQINRLHQSLNQEEEYFVFLMLARQMRLLIQMKDSGTLAGSPFVVNKVRKQTTGFSLEKLIDLHDQLLQIDLRQKTSQNRLSLTAELDLFILNL
jgi:hypothetical protein